jgi:molybdopterin converting factor small subunit
MITLVKVKPCGFLSRALGKSVSIDAERITVATLLELLQARMPPSDEPTLSRANTLVAVNDIEVSALQGEATALSDNDTVTLIPISHGG